MKQNKKYKFDLKDTIEIEGHKLYRIIALRNFSNVEEGDKGGYVEGETNLSHKYDCWVYGNARVYDDARIYGNARVYDDVRIYGNARVFEDAAIYGNARVYDDVRIYGNARVYDDVRIYGNARVFEDAAIYGNARVYDDARIYGNVRVYDDANVCGDARINSNRDYIVFKNFWSSGRYFTWTRSNNMWIVGCFHGTAEELIRKAYDESQEKGREYERVVRYVESILADEERDKEPSKQQPTQ